MVVISLEWFFSDWGILSSPSSKPTFLPAPNLQTPEAKRFLAESLIVCHARHKLYLYGCLELSAHSSTSFIETTPEGLYQLLSTPPKWQCRLFMCRHDPGIRSARPSKLPDRPECVESTCPPESSSTCSDLLAHILFHKKNR